MATVVYSTDSSNNSIIQLSTKTRALLRKCTIHHRPQPILRPRTQGVTLRPRTQGVTLRPRTQGVTLRPRTQAGKVDRAEQAGKVTLLRHRGHPRRTSIWFDTSLKQLERKKKRKCMLNHGRKYNAKRVPMPAMYLHLSQEHALACNELQRNILRGEMKTRAYHHRVVDAHKGLEKFRVTAERLLGRLVHQGTFAFQTNPKAPVARMTVVPTLLDGRCVATCRGMIRDIQKLVEDHPQHVLHFPKQLTMPPAPADESSDTRAIRMARLFIPTLEDHMVTLDLHLRNAMAAEAAGFLPANIHVTEMNSLHYLWMAATGCRYNIVYTPTGFEDFLLSDQFEQVCCPREKIISLHADYCGVVPVKLWDVAQALPNLKALAGTYSGRTAGKDGATYMFLKPGFIVQTVEGAGSIRHIVTRDQAAVTREMAEADLLVRGQYF